VDGCERRVTAGDEGGKRELTGKRSATRFPGTHCVRRLPKFVKEGEGSVKEEKKIYKLLYVAT